MAKKVKKVNEEFFIIYGGDGWGEYSCNGPFDSVKACEERLHDFEEDGVFTIVKSVVKYNVEVPVRKNVLTKKEI